MTSAQDGARPDASSFAGGLAGDVAWTYLSVLASAASSLFLVAYALRQLGPEAFGIYVLIAAVTGLALIADFALSMGVIRSTALAVRTHNSDLAESAREEVNVAHSMYVVLGSASVLLAGAVCPVLLWIGLSPEATATVLLSAAGFGLNIGLAALQGVATGVRRFDIVAISSIAGSGTTVGTAVLLVPSVGLIGLGLAQVTSAVAVRLVLGVWIKRARRELWPEWRRPTGARARATVASAGPLALTSGGAVVVAAANLALIGLLLNPAMVGLFRAASSLPTQGVQVLYRGYDVAFPTLAAAADVDVQEELSSLLTRLASFTAGLGFGLLASLAHEAIVLLTGKSSDAGALVLAIVSIYWLVNVPAHGVVLLLVARSKQQLLIPLTLVEAGLSVALTAALTARYGIPGAAWSGLITIVISNAIVLPHLVRRSMRIRVARVIFIDGYARAAVGVATAVLAAGFATEWTTGTTRIWSSLLTCVCLGLPVGLLVVGASGRRLIAAALRREAGGTGSRS